MSRIKLNPFSLAKRINRPLILDGAMGSLLQQMGFKASSNSWMTRLNTEKPEIIINVHKKYIDAGADIITTNTFRTNPYSLETDGISDVKSCVKCAVGLAKTAIDDEEILIAGSNAPAEECYQRERTIGKNRLELNHKNHIDLLIDNGVHFILNETQSHLDEIIIICEHCSMNSIPFIVSLYFDNTLSLLSGEPVQEAIKIIQDYNLLSISFNCVSPTSLDKMLPEINQNKKFNWGFYLNCGSGNQEDKHIACGVSAVVYKEVVKKSLVKKPAFIGACCGSDFEHIKMLKQLLDG